MSADDRVSALRRQLAVLEYGVGAADFVRYRDEPADDAVSGVVRSVTAEGSAGGDAFRGQLTGADVEVLRLYAQRRTLAARRRSSPGLAGEALDGFTLLARVEDVPWDTWLKAALLITRFLGGDLGASRRRFDEVASDDAVARFNVAFEAMNRVDDLAQCRLAEVHTSHGVGFVETLHFRGAPTIGFLGAPRQADNLLTYRPTTNLAQLTVTLADAMDATDRVETGPIGQDQLAATLFGLAVSGSYLETTGCLSFVADGVDGAPSFTAFVAELTDDTGVDARNGAATGTDGQVSVRLDDRLIVLSPQPSFDEGDDVEADLSEYAGLAEAALGDPATK
ncbi:MAG: hypothetical protein ACHQFZ_01410 [Acidimicrobiales bacterium]